METVLTRLCDTGLKVNAAKSLFYAHEIEYLGYILTRDGIKLQPKKVQAIFVLNPPNNVQELRHFFGMVQYYRGMWARRRCGARLGGSKSNAVNLILRFFLYIF